jgi:peroxiredoxin Q/BCP
MHVTVEVVGEESRDLEVEDATYADLLDAVGLSPHEASVMVDGRPVPEDQPVETDHVKVLRLIKGGGAETDARLRGPSPDHRAPRRTRSDVTAGSKPLSSFDVTELDFELPNAGVGPDPLALSALAAEPTNAVGRPIPRRKTTPHNDAVVLFFQRDYRSRGCREQLRAVADRYGEFRDRRAAAVAVLPESKARAEKWQTKLHLPFALVADADKRVVDQYGQPTRFGRLGSLHDLLGRLPQVAILDTRGELSLYAIHRGDGPGDRPAVDEVLAMVDRLLADGA